MPFHHHIKMILPHRRIIASFHLIKIYITAYKINIATSSLNHCYIEYKNCIAVSSQHQIKIASPHHSIATLNQNCIATLNHCQIKWQRRIKSKLLY